MGSFNRGIESPSFSNQEHARWKYAGNPMLIRDSRATRYSEVRLLNYEKENHKSLKKKNDWSQKGLPVLLRIMETNLIKYYSSIKRQ